MDYEKKHQEDLEAAKGWLAIAKENNNKIAIQIVEKFFPELKESEDERIRKALVKQFSDYSLEETFYCVKNKDILVWLEKQGEKSNYNPYKATIESISAMVEKYAPFDSNLQDFYDNIKVKCKDAMEYDNTWLEKQSEQKTAWNGEDEAGFGYALWAIEQARSIAKDGNDMGNLWHAERWLKLLKYRMKGE